MAHRAFPKKKKFSERRLQTLHSASSVSPNEAPSMEAPEIRQPIYGCSFHSREPMLPKAPATMQWERRRRGGVKPLVTW